MPVLATGFEFPDWSYYEALGWSQTSGSWRTVADGKDGGNDYQVHLTSWGAGGERSRASLGTTTTPVFGNPNTNRWACFWMRRENPTGTLNIFVYFLVSTGNTDQNGIIIFQSDSNGGKVVITNGANVVHATSTLTLDNSVGHWIEIEMVCEEAPNGLANVYVDGVLWASTSGVDMRNQGVDGWDFIQWTNGDHIIDDVIITDSTEGRPPAEFYGVRQRLNGNASVAMSPSTGTNWETVSGSVLNTTTYNESTTGGDTDLYTTQRISWADSVYGVNIGAWVARSGQASSDNNAKLAVRAGNTTGFGSLVALGSLYQAIDSFFPLNPDTASAWTEDDLDDLIVGVKTGA